jgi:hypothetical protein
MSIATVKEKVKKANVSAATLDALFTEHKIPAFFREELTDLVYYGTRPAADLLYRLKHVRNYRAWFNAMVTVLSEAYWKETGIKFPPPGWQPRKAA